jgi:hypothetical protein
MGDAERYLVGSFADCAAATDACRRIVDGFLAAAQEDARSPAALLTEYEASGPDPFIRSDDPGCRFSASSYARQRIAELFPGGAIL